MKNKIIIILILFLNTDGFSQSNLVTNSSFENHTSCPTFMLQWDKCVGWTNCNGNIGSGLWGTPDYYHTCGLSQTPYNPVPPNTGMGYCNPHTGDAMMGLVCYNAGYSNAREYITTQLACPLTPGSTYTVSFWISAQSTPEVKYNSSHFGVYLSNSAVTQSGFNLVNVIPQYEVTNLITNTIWQQHTFTISPTTNLNYITLGCFKSDAVITKVLTTPSAWQPYSNYFIDDIEVKSLASIGTLSTSVNNVSCNGLNTGSASVIPSGIGPYNYLWMPGGYTSASVNNLSAGIYTVNVSSGLCNTSTTSIVVSGPPVINLDFNYISKNLKCLDSGYFINNSVGATSYTWIFSDGTISAQINPSHNFANGNYQVTLIGENSNCRDSITKTISVLNTNAILNENAPNVFTPNNDGVNDIFDFALVANCNAYTFEIFDRWGLSLLKMSSTKQSFWDGRTTSGEAVTDGTYFYILNFDDGTKLKGTVNVFR